MTLTTNILTRPSRVPRRRTARAGLAVRDPQAAIFETTERLCAERGLEVVSVRDIARAAGVNLSAINYYYGSRANLLVTILRTRCDQLESERLALIEELQRKDRPELREILHAVLAPLARWRRPGSGRQSAMMFLARALNAAEPELQRQIDSSVMHCRALIGMLQRVLPDLSREEICCRFHFTMQLAHMNDYDAHRLQVLSDGAFGEADQDEALECAVDYARAGFLSPPHAYGARSGSAA